MINPLKKAMPVEERPDGVYIKIDRALAQRIKVEDLVRLLDDNQVINYDRERLTDIYSRARGGFERLGPAFEYYDPALDAHVQIVTTAQRATMTLNSSSIGAGVVPTPRMLEVCAMRKGVKHGIKRAVLAGMVKDAAYDKPVDIAEATPPAAGKDARIELAPELSAESKPQVRADGSVDYRNIQTFTPVEKGQVLAKKIPPTSGVPGRTVTGDPIPPVPGKDVPLPRGKNTEESKDGMELVASKAGILHREPGGLIQVLELLQVTGDVDFSVGNVKYTGDVVVTGSVLPGFSVEAEGNVEIRGDVESAKIISRNAAVKIGKGVIGKSDTLISGKTGVDLAFAQEAQIESDGPIVVEKYLFHCDCVCESFEAKDAHSSIVGGTIKAEKSVELRQLGSDRGVKTSVILFDRKKAANEEKLVELADLEAKLSSQAGPVEKQLKTKAALLRKADSVSDRNKQDLKKLLEAYNTITMKIKYVKQKTEELKREIANPKTYDGYIRVSGIIYPGCELRIYGITIPVTGQMANKCFRLINNVIHTEG